MPNATVKPLACAVMVRHFGKSLEELAQRYAVAGGEEAAVQLREALAQLQEIARQRAEAQRLADASDDGSGSSVVESGCVQELTTRQVAGRLGFTSPRQVTRMCKNRVLTARTVGRVWLVDAASVEDYLDARRSA